MVFYYWAIYVSLSRKSRIHDVSIRIKALLSMKEFKFVDHSKSSNRLLKVSEFVACIRGVSHSIPGDGGFFYSSIFFCVQVGSWRDGLLSSGCRGLSLEDKAVEACD